MKLLVTHDGSQRSNDAIRAVASMVLSPGSEILVISVISHLLPLPIIDPEPVDLEDERIRRSIQLQEAIHCLSSAQPEAKVRQRILFGTPTQAILDTAHEWTADLVVIGARGHGGLHRLLLGSVSQAVLEKAGCPVLVLRPGSESGQAVGECGGRKILLPLDGSLFSFDTVDWLASQDWQIGSCFKLLMAIPEFKKPSPSQLSVGQAEVLEKQWQQIKQSAFEMLEEHALRLGNRVGNSHVSIEVVPGDPKRAILEVAERWEVDIIAMGSHGRSALECMLVGSVSRYIATHFSGSVLIVRRLSSPDSRRAAIKRRQKELEEKLEASMSISTKNGPGALEDIVPHVLFKP